MLMMKGSSPLTRGKRPMLRDPSAWRGLIPAHAGKTGPSRTPVRLSWAHPRSRGENHAPGAVGGWKSGSSPLTRGKQGADGGGHRGAGLIPAHAGKTGWRGAGCCGAWAHPRSRGENASRWLRAGVAAGSSPLTRGKHVFGAWVLVLSGLIPAHAGKTRSRSSRRHDARAHPRSRGENTS